MNQPNERWLPIPGYEGLYEVSDQGRVRSVERYVRRGKSSMLVRQRDRKLSSRDGIYLGTVLWKEGVQQYHRVHNLVTEAFLGPRPLGAEVRHGRGGSLDNSLSNLTYGTSGENKQDTVDHGRHWLAKRDRCKHGHEYTPENTTIRVRDGKRARVCRKCKRQRWEQEKADPDRRAAKAERDRQYYLQHRSISGRTNSV